jgi:hypothetical protein
VRKQRRAIAAETEAERRILLKRFFDLPTADQLEAFRAIREYLLAGGEAELTELKQQLAPRA